MSNKIHLTEQASIPSLTPTGHRPMTVEIYTEYDHEVGYLGLFLPNALLFTPDDQVAQELVVAYVARAAIEEFDEKEDRSGNIAYNLLSDMINSNARVCVIVQAPGENLSSCFDWIHSRDLTQLASLADAHERLLKLEAVAYKSADPVKLKSPTAKL